ncbi:MAG: VOC family protein [Saprospiraceae bacterium]
MRKLLLPGLLLLIPVVALSQREKLPAPIPYFNSIIVTDIDTTIHWYETILGFELINRTDNEERGFRQANLQGGNCLIELIQLKNAMSPEALMADQPANTRLTGYFKFGFKVTDFEAWMEYLENTGTEFQGSVVTDPTSGKRMMIIRDPDGNRVQLFEA